MKTELFLKKIGENSAVESIEKTKFGYEVKLREGYVFAELNTNERTFSNQGIVEEYLKEFVKRSYEEVERFNKIKKLEYKLDQEKHWHNYYLKRQKENERTIKRNESEIKDYERYILNCNERIEKERESSEFNKKQVEEHDVKIETLEKELQEL
ncbi:MAG: hypothetical protein ACRCXQ_09355 [Vagococcus fluvialis]